MWNSWVDKEIIAEVKKITENSKEWFFLKSWDKSNYRDRMENEELLMTLSYFNYKKQIGSKTSFLVLHPRDNRLNARIGNKKDITHVLTEVSTDLEKKKMFLTQIKETVSLVKKCKTFLLQENKVKSELSSYLKRNLDWLFNPFGRKNFRRTRQDYYILWLLISPINFEMVKHFRDDIIIDVRNLFKKFRATSHDVEIINAYEDFIRAINEFHIKYSQDKRTIVLSDKEIRLLIKKQGYICPISGARLRLGDEIEVDHRIPLAVGGKEKKSNLQLVHKDNNRKKRASII